MNNVWKIAIVALLAAAVAATFAMRGAKRARDLAAVPVVKSPVAQPASPVEPPEPKAAPVPAPVVAGTVAARTAGEKAVGKPRLLELGSMRCMACLEMAKVLDALRASQGEKLQVDFIDVNEDLEAADRYRIKLIPTQILYDTAGREIFRHEGFFSHDDILGKFRQLGVRL